MLKFSDIIGLPVIHIGEGNIIGTVRDIVFISKTKKITGLIIRTKSIVSSMKVIKAQDIVKVGKSAVLVSSNLCMQPVKEFLSTSTSVKRYQEDISEKQIFTDGGEKIGVIQDAIFNFEAGLLEEFEISDGLVQDLMEGRKVISSKEIIHLDQGIVIIESEKANHLKDKQKGLKKLLLERKE